MSDYSLMAIADIELRIKVRAGRLARILAFDRHPPDFLIANTIYLLGLATDEWKRRNPGAFRVTTPIERMEPQP